MWATCPVDFILWKWRSKSAAVKGKLWNCLQTTGHEMIPTVVGVSGAVRGTTGLLLVGTTDWKHKRYRAACVESMHSANAFCISSSNSSFTTKSCSCASIPFLWGIISWSVDKHLLGLNNLSSIPFSNIIRCLLLSKPTTSITILWSQ
jgi:hypothetical protein